MYKIKKNNDAIYGPLQIKGEFNYDINELNINEYEELCKFMKYIDKDVDIDIIKKNYIFTRIIKIDLGNSKLTVGMILVNVIENKYNINYIAVHPLFRNQGIGTLLIMTLANYIMFNTNNEIEIVSIHITYQSINLINLFRKLKFNEMLIFDKYHMLKTTNIFTDILNSPI